MSCRIIGIAGGSGSGKTTLCEKLATLWGEQCVVISSDDYYRRTDGISPEDRDELNFDHPDSLELDLLASHLRRLRDGKDVEVPQYCFKTHNRVEEVRAVSPRKIILVEGVLIFVEPVLREVMDLRVFVDADDAVRFGRRCERDTVKRQRSAASVKHQWETTVAPMYAEFVSLTKQFAHLVVNTNENCDLVDNWLGGGIR